MTPQTHAGDRRREDHSGSDRGTDGSNERILLIREYLAFAATAASAARIERRDRAGLFSGDESGGFSGLRRVAALADGFDLPVMPHFFGTAVNFHASLRMAAMLTARRGGGPAPYPYLEVNVTPNPLFDFAGDIRPDSDGTIRVPDTPGLGLDIDRDRLSPWIVASWSERQD